jgi:hypothetical protein
MKAKIVSNTLSRAAKHPLLGHQKRPWARIFVPDKLEIKSPVFHVIIGSFLSAILHRCTQFFEQTYVAANLSLAYFQLARELPWSARIFGAYELMEEIQSVNNIL